jgi:glutamate---cysteine ligase / carboxylate-amine ligase
MLATRPAWALWKGDEAPTAYTLGIEEELMLVDPTGWSLASRSEDVLEAVPDTLAARATAETHGSALELRTGVHSHAREAADELRGLRAQLAAALEPFGLRAAAAGLHPFTLWSDTVLSRGPRYQLVHGSMRELARREPTFALHVHVGVRDPESAVLLANRMRAHLPVILALSANSPFWQGRDTGLASARTPLFQGFPRVGIPRAYASYSDFVEAVDLLIRCDAVPEPTFLWWDVRLQPRFGTVEIRIPDAQTTVDDAVALAAFVQCLARLELEVGHAHHALLGAPEALEENRFLAARDGMRAELVMPERGGRVPVTELVEELLIACSAHAAALGCRDELGHVGGLVARPVAERQREVAAEGGKLSGLVERLADRFLA